MNRKISLTQKTTTLAKLALNIIVLFTIAAQAHSSNASTLALKRPDLDNLRQRVYSSWAPTKQIVGLSNVYVKVSATANGQLYDVCIERTSGDRQLDADCLQAVMGASRSCPIKISVEELDHFSIKFGSKTPVGHTHDGISRYFAKHPEYQKDWIAFYRVPLDVLKRYPGLFTEQELLDESNIGLIEAIDRDNPKLPNWVSERLKFLYQHLWVPFFVSHPSVTREQVLEFKKKHIVDEKQLLEPETEK